VSQSSLPKKIRKRDGSVVAFDLAKIANAICKAALEVTGKEARSAAISSQVTGVVLEELARSFKDKIPEIEQIQDAVESALMSEGYSHIARSYILYRARHRDIRIAKSALDLRDDLKLPVNTMEVLRRRYLRRDDKQNIIETPSELFRRVAAHVASGEENFKGGPRIEDVEEKFYRMMRLREFMPNSPTLMNAGTALGQLSACFVLPVEDSIEGIFESLRNMARIHQTGGGTGFSFSRLRRKGALVSSTKGRASGPVSFMSIFDKATGVIVQGGRRRGANMGILRIDHPDVVEFIEAKVRPGRFDNFNLSIAVTDRFMRAVHNDAPFDLRDPRTGRKSGSVRARSLFDLIVNAAWRTGDPGLVFIDEINRRNPTPELGEIEATNPCGELPLLPFESCNLASINLAQMVDAGKLDWRKLAKTVAWGIRFLDDVIEVSRHPLPQIERITRANRKVGLGVMGFADMLIKLDVPYNTRETLDLARKLMRFIRKESLNASAELAKHRRPFPNFKKSVYARDNLRLRNATVNTIAPTGTISIIAGCSSGIEPLFALSFMRNVLSGTKLFEVNPFFEQAARKASVYSEQLMGEIARKGSIQNVASVPKELKRLFVTAFDISADDHLAVQAAFQKYTDNAVSKTINLPHDATAEDVRHIYLTAHRLRCKGITIYRYGSKDEQVLSIGDGAEGQYKAYEGPVTASAEYSGGCVTGACAF
jgi:ribonucleoside-diphosphate reductase alpha chain